MLEVKAIKDVLGYCNIVRDNAVVKNLKIKGCWNIQLYLVGNLFIFQEDNGGCFTFEVKFLKEIFSKKDFDFDFDLNLFRQAVIAKSGDLQKDFVDYELLVHNWSQFCEKNAVDSTDLIYVVDEITDFFDQAEKRDDVSVQKTHDFLVDRLQDLPYGKLPLKTIMDASYNLPRESLHWDKDFEFACKFLFAMNDKYLKDFFD